MCKALHWHGAWKSSCFCNEICRSHFMTGEMFVFEVFFAEHISSMFSRSMCAWVVGDVGGDNCVTYLSTQSATTDHPIQPQPDILTIFVFALLANFPRMCCAVRGKIQIEAKVWNKWGCINEDMWSTGICLFPVENTRKEYSATGVACYC